MFCAHVMLLRLNKKGLVRQSSVVQIIVLLNLAHFLPETEAALFAGEAPHEVGFSAAT